MTDSLDHRSSSWHPRRTALVSSAALAIAVTIGGATQAGAATSVAGTVQGALVEIVSTQAYTGATGAGTGMILSSDGEILTNNHVIEGATSIEVTVMATGASYQAEVVGTAPSQDVAVLQLEGASGLKTIPLGDSAALQVGQRVVASGNAGGTGEISTVTGTVTDLDQAITASDEGANAEHLSGLIETDAPIVAGDSGGALATTAGKVIGMNTAASVRNNAARASAGSSSAAEAYAIPIGTALKIANQIESGQASSTVHIGPRGMLGVQLATTSSGEQGFYGRGNGFGNPYQTAVSGALIAGIVTSGPAASAGLQAGDTITSIDGAGVDSATTLDTIMAATTPGQEVVVTWTTASGVAQTATITLGTAAAD